MMLPNGTVIPHGILSEDSSSSIAAFNRMYNNTSIRAGIVTKCYSPQDPGNLSKLIPEYDVLVLEQSQDQGITPLTYRNCVAVDGFGSIADFLEYTVREQKSYTASEGKDIANQDGAIVLVQFLDGSAEKGLIVGGLKHPDRPTDLKSGDPRLAGEYNGVRVDVFTDGSAKLTFKGATDNKGKPTDPSQGNTTLDIEKDGSVQIQNKGVTQRLEKEGNFSVRSGKNSSINAEGAIALTAAETITTNSTEATNMSMSEFLLQAQGSAIMESKSAEIKASIDALLQAKSIKIQGQSLVEIQASNIIAKGIVSLGSAGGLPALTPITQMIGIGNLGAPVLSIPVGPFATRVFLV